MKMKMGKMVLIGSALLAIIGLGVYRAFAAPSNPTGCYTVKNQECVDTTQMAEDYWCSGTNVGGSVNVVVDPAIPDGSSMGPGCGEEFKGIYDQNVTCGQFKAGTQCN